MPRVRHVISLAAAALVSGLLSNAVRAQVQGIPAGFKGFGSSANEPAPAVAAPTKSICYQSACGYSCGSDYTQNTMTATCGPVNICCTYAVPGVDSQGKEVLYNIETYAADSVLPVVYAPNGSGPPGLAICVDSVANKVYKPFGYRYTSGQLYVACNNQLNPIAWRTWDDPNVVSSKCSTSQQCLDSITTSNNDCCYQGQNRCSMGSLTGSSISCPTGSFLLSSATSAAPPASTPAGDATQASATKTIAITAGTPLKTQLPLPPPRPQRYPDNDQTVRIPGDLFKDPLVAEYDDGPSKSSGPDTAKIQTELAALGANATFFVTGTASRQNVATLRATYAAGYHVASHTYTHHPLTSATNEEIVAELKYTESVIYETLGVVPRFFRPPYGDIDDRVRAIAYALGYTPIIWEGRYDSQDWRDTVPEESAVAALVGYAKSGKPGFISLEHDISERTSGIAVRALQKIRAQGLHNTMHITSVAQCLNEPAYADPSLFVKRTIGMCPTYIIRDGDMW
ncbi:chitin deacetylase [Geranomyces michiganensis]|nr:chitin deacetylase [Geranomyces michiganensis]